MVCAAASGAYEAKREGRAERKEGTSRNEEGSSEESLEKGRCVTCKRTVN